jgi:ACDE family multidrug resistance protein
VRFRQPLGLLFAEGDSGRDIARLAGVEGFTRALTVGTVPIAALAALGSTMAVSVYFTIGSAFAILATLGVAPAERRFARRWIVSGAITFVFFSSALFAYGPTWTIPIAIALRAAQASVFAVTMSLYIMDNIGKEAVPRVESRRVVYLAVAWLAGPAIGTWLWGSGYEDAPFLLSMMFAVVLLSYHWRLRFTRNDILITPTRRAPNPAENVRRFLGQRYLRVAGLISGARSVLWGVVFIYGPIYVVEAGLDEWVAGAFLSAASALLLLSPLVYRASLRWGVRRTIVIAFSISAFALVWLGLIRDPRPIGIVPWMIVSLGGAMLDVLGNIPFMRLVRPRERPEMTSVLTVGRDLSFVLTPALAAIVLLFGPIWMLYLVVAIAMAATAAATTSLPRRI